MNTRILTSEIRSQEGVVFTRKRAKDLARMLGFERQDQTRIATAVSEIARNAFEYGSEGIAEFILNQAEPGSPAAQAQGNRLLIRITDRGHGISDPQGILDGRYQSETGMGVGIIGAKQLVDTFSIETAEGKGSCITLGKNLPPTAASITPSRIRAIVDELSKVQFGAISEVQEQNQELLHAMEDLREKQLQTEQLNRELEDTNRGVVALYGELDEKAEALKKANTMKTRFLSNITHEFRTPLGATINLAEMLLAGLEGPLTENQYKTIGLIKKSNEALLELVNDLLDLAKVEAGRVPVRATHFLLGDLFSSLRSLLRPLAELNPKVGLEFEELPGDFSLFNDEAKILQILRNLISNSLKYTEAGSVKVQARKLDARSFEISVADTGIGIARKDLERIFEEFTQVESPQQKKHKGTGIGLALTRQLVQLLDGEIRLSSEPGVGTVFFVVLPIRYSGAEEKPYVVAPRETRTTPPPRVLIIDDEIGERYFLRSVLSSRFGCEALESSSGKEGLQAVEASHPSLIFLDLNMPDMNGFQLLRELKSKETTRNIPVVIHSGKELSASEREELKEARAILSKTANTEEQLMTQITEIMRELAP